MTYHNTTHETGQDLTDAQNITKGQDNIVLSVFNMFPENEMSPSDVWLILESLGYKYILTSVRRAITNLTIKGHLVHTENKKPGLHGRPNTTWKCR